MKKNNLERAKELKERDIIYINKKISEFPYSDSMNKIFKEAKELLEGTKKGCGCYLMPVGSYNSCGQVKRSLNAIMGKDEEILYCEDCQETIKICEEILQ